MARYAELEIWRQAHESSYMPLPETGNLDDFKDYANFEQRWSRELDQFSQMADDIGDGRFYYTGMAQAVLLDRISPEWKTNAFDQGVWLDDLLAIAVQE